MSVRAFVGDDASVDDSLVDEVQAPAIAPAVQQAYSFQLSDNAFMVTKLPHLLIIFLDEYKYTKNFNELTGEPKTAALKDGLCESLCYTAMSRVSSFAQHVKALNALRDSALRKRIELAAAGDHAAANAVVVPPPLSTKVGDQDVPLQLVADFVREKLPHPHDFLSIPEPTFDSLAYDATLKDAKTLLGRCSLLNRHEVAQNWGGKDETSLLKSIRFTDGTRTLWLINLIKSSGTFIDEILASSKTGKANQQLVLSGSDKKEAAFLKKFLIDQLFNLSTNVNRELYRANRDKKTELVAIDIKNKALPFTTMEALDKEVQNECARLKKTLFQLQAKYSKTQQNNNRVVQKTLQESLKKEVDKKQKTEVKLEMKEEENVDLKFQNRQLQQQVAEANARAPNHHLPAGFKRPMGNVPPLPRPNTFSAPSNNNNNINNSMMMSPPSQQQKQQQQQATQDRRRQQNTNDEDDDPDFLGLAGSGAASSPRNQTAQQLSEAGRRRQREGNSVKKGDNRKRIIYTVSDDGRAYRVPFTEDNVIKMVLTIWSDANNNNKIVLKPRVWFYTFILVKLKKIKSSALTVKQIEEMVIGQNDPVCTLLYHSGFLKPGKFFGEEDKFPNDRWKYLSQIDPEYDDVVDYIEAEKSGSDSSNKGNKPAIYNKLLDEMWNYAYSFVKDTEEFADARTLFREQVLEESGELPPDSSDDENNDEARDEDNDEQKKPCNSTSIPNSSANIEKKTLSRLVMTAIFQMNCPLKRSKTSTAALTSPAVLAQSVLSVQFANATTAFPEENFVVLRHWKRREVFPREFSNASEWILRMKWIVAQFRPL